MLKGGVSTFWNSTLQMNEMSSETASHNVIIDNYAIKNSNQNEIIQY